MKDIYSIKMMYESGKISQEQIDPEIQKEMINLVKENIIENLKEIEKNENEISENKKEIEMRKEKIEQIRQNIISIREDMAIMDKNSEMYKRQIAEMEKDEVLKKISDKIENLE